MMNLIDMLYYNKLRPEAYPMKKLTVVLLVSLLLLSCVPILSAEWASDPAENTPIGVTTGDQVLPKIAVASDGSSYICWFSTVGNYNVRLQCLDYQGNALWPDNGILISDKPQDSWITDYDLAVDSLGYAIITFTDIRTGQSNPVGYRVSPDGEMMWGTDGVMLANDVNFDPSPKCCGTESGAGVFAWQSAPDSGNSAVHVKKVDANGQVLWEQVYSDADISYTAPYVLPGDGENVYLIWHQETGPYYAPNRGLYAMELDADGAWVWGSIVNIYAPVAEGPVVYLRMCRDDNNGIAFTWYRSIDMTHFDSYVQHIDKDGVLTMPVDGVLVSTYSNRLHMYPAVAFLPTSQEIVVYFSEQDQNQNQRGLYAQALDLEGNRLWGDAGKELIPLSNSDYALPMASGTDNVAICVYQASTDGMNCHMQAVMLDKDGNFVWDTQFVDLSTVESQKLHAEMSDYFSGQWVAVWEDLRNDGGDVYAQNIQLDGTLGPVMNQPPVVDFSWTPEKPLPFDVVQFTDLSHDDIGYIANWTWSFGDGASSHAQNPTHQYTDAGMFTVTLTAMDDAGLSASVSKDLVVGANFNVTVSGGLGVSLKIINLGATDAAGIPYQMHVKGGILGKIDKTVNGTIDIPAGETKTVKTGILFGFGALTITGSVSEYEVTASGTQLLFFSMVKN
jgi:hypothetical protein